MKGQLELFPASTQRAACPKQTALTSLTNNQQVLIVYYSLLASGIKPRITVDLAPIAQFMHLMLDKPYKGLQNSDLYKRLQTVPNFENRKNLMRDWERIQPFFLRVAWKDALQLIENDLIKARSQLNNPLSAIGAV